jgi:hypothetical protein
VIRNFSRNSVVIRNFSRNERMSVGQSTGAAVHFPLHMQRHRVRALTHNKTELAALNIIKQSSQPEHWQAILRANAAKQLIVCFEPAVVLGVPAARGLTSAAKTRQSDV